jgi:hypothetical protein
MMMLLLSHSPLRKLRSPFPSRPRTTVHLFGRQLYLTQTYYRVKADLLSRQP